MRAVLADTGPLFALVDPSDEHHGRAHEDYRTLQQQRTQVVVIYPIVLETYKLLLRNVRLGAAQAWLAEIGEVAALINPVTSDYDAASERVRRYTDQAITLEDALLAGLSERLRLPVWTLPCGYSQGIISTSSEQQCGGGKTSARYGCMRRLYPASPRVMCFPPAPAR